MWFDRPAVCTRAAVARSAAALIGALLVSGCASESGSQLQVVATTTNLASLIREIGGERIAVRVLVPPGSCPGHYDMRPGDARAVARSGLLFAHDYEQFVPRLVESAGSPQLRTFRLEVEGNWLVPEVRARAAGEVARALGEAEPEHREAYERRAAEAAGRIKAIEAELRRDLDEAVPSGRFALCSDQLEPVVRWMGFEIAGTYGRPEELTPPALHRLLETGRAQKISLVVDNLQSGPHAGAGLAGDIGAAHVTLSNFPGGFPDTETWDACLRDNVRRVIAALGETRSKVRSDDAERG